MRNAAHLPSAPLTFANLRVEPVAPMKKWGGRNTGTNTAKGNFCSKIKQIVREKYFKTLFKIWIFPLIPRIYWLDHTKERALRQYADIFLYVSVVSAMTFYILKRFHFCIWEQQPFVFRINYTTTWTVIHKVDLASQPKIIFEPLFHKHSCSWLLLYYIKK